MTSIRPALLFLSLILLCQSALGFEAKVSERFWVASEKFKQLLPLSAAAAAAYGSGTQPLHERRQFLTKDSFQQPDTEALLTRDNVELHLNRNGLQLIRNF